MYAIVTATQEHVAQMLPHVRQADRYEVMASSGRPIEGMLGKCVADSELAWAGMVGDEVACIFGVQGMSMISEAGSPWLIGTDLIEAHAKPFLRRNRKMVAVMLARFPRLENYVDVRNAKSIQWLQWLGFQMHEPAPYGLYRMPFMKFTKEASCVNQPQ